MNSSSGSDAPARPAPATPARWRRPLRPAGTPRAVRTGGPGGWCSVHSAWCTPRSAATVASAVKAMPSMTYGHPATQPACPGEPQRPRARSPSRVRSRIAPTRRSDHRRHSRTISSSRAGVSRSSVRSDKGASSGQAAPCQRQPEPARLVPDRVESVPAQPSGGCGRGDNECRDNHEQFDVVPAEAEPRILDEHDHVLERGGIPNGVERVG